jgi:hypothetical protein
MKIGQEVLGEAALGEAMAGRPDSYITGGVYNDRANIGIGKFVEISKGTFAWKAPWQELKKIVDKGWDVAMEHDQIVSAGVEASGGKLTKKKVLPSDVFVSTVAGGLYFSPYMGGSELKVSGKEELTEAECKAVAEAVSKKASELGYKGEVEARWEKPR